MLIDYIIVGVLCFVFGCFTGIGLVALCTAASERDHQGTDLKKGEDDD